MRRRNASPWWPWIAMLAMYMLAGCQALAGVEDTTIFPDSGPETTYAVEGMAAGVIEPLGVQLLYTGGSEVLSIDGDGPFAFAKRLVDGDIYVVELAGPNPCSIANYSGTVAGMVPTVDITCMLTDIDMIGPAVNNIVFAPAEEQYDTDASILQQSVVVTATAARSDLAITVAGATVASGVPSDPIMLAPGDNAIDVVVDHAASGWRRVYDITISRTYGISQYAYIKGSNTDAADKFGSSVAVWGDRLAVGASAKDSAGPSGGEVYVFRREGAMWVEEARFTASNIDAGDYFGGSVALWGDTLAVGATGEDSAATGVDGDGSNNSVSGSGAVYIFRRTDQGWEEEAYIKATNTGDNYLFGSSVALWEDTLVVGAPGEGDPVAASGAAYVFGRSNGMWAEEAHLMASNAGADDGFGESVAIWGDRLAVGAPGEAGMNDALSQSGAVYVFRRDGSSWAEEAKLKVANPAVDDGFGESVALWEDALAVGVPYRASNIGAVSVFRRIGAEWTEEASVNASNPDTDDRFGVDVALWGDSLAVGAIYEDSGATGADGDQGNAISNSGAVYLFRHDGSGWMQQEYIKASNTGKDDLFGSDVALCEHTLAISATGEDSNATGIGGDQSDDSADGSGAVYVIH